MYNIVLATGPPLNGRDDYLGRVVSEHSGSPEIRVYSVFRYMQRAGEEIGYPNITRENILDMPSQLLRDLRFRALRLILDEIKECSGCINIVSTPNVFHVRPHGDTTYAVETAVDEEFLARLRPGLVLLMIDNLVDVYRRFQGDPVWSKRLPEFTLETAAQWREVSIRSMSWAARQFFQSTGQRIEVIQFSVHHPPSVFIDLLLGYKPRVYLSYNMTGMPPESFANVRRFYEKLRRYFTVFDPGTIKDWELIEVYEEAVEKGEKTIRIDGEEIEIERVPGIERAIDLARAQLVSRDLNLVRSSHAVAVYHHGRYPSYGVMAEVMTASGQGIPVYVYYPYKRRPSPFFEHYIATSYGLVNRLFSPRYYPGKAPEELEDLVIATMVEDACRGTWLTVKPHKEFVEKHCPQHARPTG